MHALLVCYDLNAPGKDYSSLIQAIQRIANGWWHHLDSTWIIKTDMTPLDVVNNLKVHIDRNDELLVVKASPGAAAWIGFNQEASDWMSANL